LHLWIFAYNGLTGDAEKFASEHGIMWSTLVEFNQLLELVGLRQLPTFPKEEVK
jgi:hypothetical protein